MTHTTITTSKNVAQIVAGDVFGIRPCFGVSVGVSERTKGNGASGEYEYCDFVIRYASRAACSVVAPSPQMPTHAIA